MNINEYTEKAKALFNMIENLKYLKFKKAKDDFFNKCLKGYHYIIDNYYK